MYRLLALVVALAGCQPPPGLPATGRSQCRLAGEAQPPDPAILFGDLHAHTSSSFDGLLVTLPLFDGRPYGPEDACDFARYCAQLDFWSINDHAEEMLPELWRENIEGVRTCNDRFGGYSTTPEMVTYLGWEWTQSTDDAATDFGHHNVVLKDTCESQIPPRALAAPASFGGVDLSLLPTFRDIIVGLDPDNAEIYDAAIARLEAFENKPACDPEVDTRQLPADCHEVGQTPADLYEWLARWGLEAIAIPHGTAWGTHHAQRVSWNNRFNPRQLSPRYSPLVEVHSGHGNSEEYRSFRHAHAGSGGPVCPPPTDDFEACCWRAGEITRERSDACQADPTGATCEAEVAAARAEFLAAGKRGHLTIAGADADDWRDCGQCRDCFQPALLLRPERTVQSALALTSFEDPEAPWRFVFGMVSSSDSHQSGPGAGYKEMAEMTDAAGPAREEFEFVVEQALRQITPDHARQESFNYGGGLVAVHASGRDRESIWEALKARRVYATSGDRIELWFDLVSEPARHPMGAVVETAAIPELEILARGAPVQEPGCPDWVVQKKGDEFVNDMCFGECFNPTGRRRAITQIEIVKITPQVRDGEPIGDLVLDPYRVLPCEPGARECRVRFRDEAYATDGRPATYYARALQEPTEIFNADTLRCDRDSDGVCVDTNPCQVGFEGDGDDCLAPGQERAWSSPIYLYPPGHQPPPAAR